MAICLECKHRQELYLNNSELCFDCYLKSVGNVDDHSHREKFKRAVSKAAKKSKKAKSLYAKSKIVMDTIWDEMKK